MKQVIIITSCLLCLIQFKGQAQQNCFSEIDSIESIQTNLFLDSRAIAGDENGDYYITGGRMSDSIYYNGNLSIGQGAIFLAKFRNHQLLWIERGSHENDFGYGNSVALDNNDNVIIGGWYEQELNFGKDTLNNLNGSSQNTFIAKFRPDGSHLWSKRIHTPGKFSTGQVTSLSTDKQGNIYFGGVFGGTLIFGQDTMQSWGFGDNYWGKMDSTGNLEWIKSAGGNLIERGVNVVADKNGSLYVLGQVNSSQDSAYVDDSLFYQGYGFIVKYSTSGQKQWLRGAEKGFLEMGKSMTEGRIDVRNGAVLITGMMFNANGIIKIAGVHDSVNHREDKGIAVVLKMDTSGNGIWLKEILRSPSHCSGRSIEIKDNGNIALVASTYNNLVSIIPYTGDTLTLNYSPPIYFNLNGINGHVNSYCYPQQPGNGYRLAESITTFGDTILATGAYSNKTNGNRKIFVAKITSNLTGIEEVNIPLQDIKVYPNPNTGAFTIELPEIMNEEANRLNIFRVNGQQVFSERINNTQNPRKINVQLPELPQGIYFLSIEHDQGIVTKKFLIQ